MATNKKSLEKTLPQVEKNNNNELARSNGSETTVGDGRQSGQQCNRRNQRKEKTGGVIARPPPRSAFLV